MCDLKSLWATHGVVGLGSRNTTVGAFGHATANRQTSKAHFSVAHPVVVVFDVGDVGCELVALFVSGGVVAMKSQETRDGIDGAIFVFEVSSPRLQPPLACRVAT